MIHHHPLSTKNLISDLENYNPLGVHQRGSVGLTQGIVKTTSSKNDYNGT